MAPRSEVWPFFTKINSTSVKCEICNKVLKCSNNTTNMMQHLKLKHSNEAKNLKIRSKSNMDVVSLYEDSDNESADTSAKVRSNNPINSTDNLRSNNSDIASTSSNAILSLKQPSIKTSVTNLQSYAFGGSKHQKLTQSLVDMIIMDNLPFSHVEGNRYPKANIIIYQYIHCRKRFYQFYETKFALVQSAVQNHHIDTR